MTSRLAQVFALSLLGVVMLWFGATAQAANDDAAPAVPRRGGSLPIVAEHRYRMAAKIRPLLLFWIGRENVGGAQVVWRRSPDGAAGFELLIGSDPARAPRRINRWGYIAEEVRGSEARLLGVMKQSNEQSLDEAKSRLAQEAQEGHYVFKAINAMASAKEASSAITTIRLAHDLTFRDLEALLEIVEHDSADAVMRRVPLPSGTRPGFLVALSELINRSVEAHTRRAADPPPGTSSLPYIYNGAVSDLTLRKSELLHEAHIGTRTYADVVRAQFAARNRATRNTTDFELLYGTSGPLSSVPIYAVYRPNWWFEVELFLDAADQS